MLTSVKSCIHYVVTARVDAALGSKSPNSSNMTRYGLASICSQSVAKRTSLTE